MLMIATQNLVLKTTQKLNFIIVDPLHDSDSSNIGSGPMGPPGQKGEPGRNVCPIGNFLQIRYRSTITLQISRYDEYIIHLALYNFIRSS